MEFKCYSGIKTAKDYANRKTVEKHDNKKKQWNIPTQKLLKKGNIKILQIQDNIKNQMEHDNLKIP